MRWEGILSIRERAVDDDKLPRSSVLLFYYRYRKMTGDEYSENELDELILSYFELLDRYQDLQKQLGKSFSSVSFHYVV